MLKQFIQQGRNERRGESYTEPYVEPLSDVRTPLGDCFSILLFAGSAALRRFPEHQRVRFPFKITPLHGVWERTGPGQFGVTSLMLGFDPATNVLVAIGRARADIRFDGDFDHLAGTLYGELLFCPTPFSCPNPTDPAAPWITTTPPVPFTAIRVRRVPAGLLP